jgi:hypothetical protein
MAQPRTRPVPSDLFEPVVEAPDDEAPEPTPLERFLGRTRTPDGKLVPRKKRVSRSVSPARYEQIVDETREMMRTRCWDDCAPRHLVALYDLLHEETYGVDACLTSKDRHRAQLLFGGFVKRVFDGEVTEAILYFFWAWKREKEREAWRRENHRDGMRLGVGLLCSSGFTADYKLHLHRNRR